jgi:glycine/D-amino acid oxidase-like deaminating enzyme
MDELGLALKPRPALAGDTEVDVAIVGAGYSGLWTAYYLMQADPSLRIAIIESEIAGYGGSGRNGGWCSAIFPTSWERIAAENGIEGLHRLQGAMNDTVDEIGRVCDAEEVNCDFEKSGYVALARNEGQWRRAKESIAEARRWGFGEDQLRLLNADEASKLVPATNVLGATFTPHCAVLNPAKLTRNLADVVERQGVRIYERTRATRIGAGKVMTQHGTVTAQYVVRATEAYTRDLPGQRRKVVPIYALAVATEPLTDEMWSTLGMQNRHAFNDLRHIRIWGQRTASGRIVFGGRGAPYHFASSVEPEFDRNNRIHAGLQGTLIDLFPKLEGVRFTHGWGGPVGIPRDWHPSVGLDRTTGMAWAGPYVGDGVATTNLAGRILRDLILAHDTEVTRLPIANHRSPTWEPEPLRWLAINSGLHIMGGADRSEARRGVPSRRARVFTKLIGGH